MSVYVIGQIHIHDRERYADYEAGFMAIFAKYKGELLSVDENPQTLEGDWNCSRTVLISFPSEADAKAWYFSDEYQELAQHRIAASDANIIVATGLTPS